ncbi:MAG: O-acetylhomoserine sulfhydrylase [Spirochaetes bacterium GWB1_36_13]|nr:MAG: O-acetylhomoserine sulfhydrylase [Spirochaetes bacterium GWB1_36_13]
MKGFTTKAIHGDLTEANPYGALRGPVYQNIAFDFSSAEELENAFLGKTISHSYSRISNPTNTELERKITYLTGGQGAIAVSSGMAAIANVILALGKSGNNIIASNFSFGNTVSLIHETLKDWGLTVKTPDFHYPEEIEKEIDKNTSAIFLETISNPQLAVFDIEKIGKIAEKYKIPLVLDNTAATPYLFQAKKYGVSVEVLSAAKYISGGGVSIGGLIVDLGNFNWSLQPKMKDLYKKSGPFSFLVKLRREVYRNLGACLAPQNAFFQILGLETLGLRIEKSSDNALALARFFKSYPQVEGVNYPGLPESVYHENAKKIFNNCFGGILTFKLSDKAKCFQFMNRLKIIRRATNINDNKSLVIHPSSTIFCDFDEKKKKALGVCDNLIRLSAGIEDLEDLKEDIDNALRESE